MKKRFNLTWRIMVSLILVLSLVPALIATTGGIAMAAGPTVWLDPIPAYINAAGAATLTFSGTSLATAPREVMDILIQIKFKDSVTNTWLYWDGTANDWSTISDSYNYADTLTAVGLGSWGVQQDWTWTGVGDFIPGAASLTNGITYTVTVWALDDNIEKGTSVSRTFIYDNTLPTGSAIQVIGDATDTGNPLIPWEAHSITAISGVAKDATPGAIGQVWVILDDTTDTTCWDGTSWTAGLGSSQILATGTTSWSVTTSTTPVLPNFISGHEYTVTLEVYDKAGNQETGPITQDFAYNKVPSSGLAVTMDTMPSYMQAANFVQITGSSKATAGVTNFIHNAWVKVYNNAARFWDDGTGTWQVGDPAIWNPGAAQDATWDDDAIEPWIYTGTGLFAAVGDGFTYTITARVQDTTLASKDSSSQTIIIDDTLPINTIITSMGITTYLGTTVFEGSTYEDLIQGTAGDVTGGTAKGKVGKVVVTIDDLTDTMTWNGINWEAGAGYELPADANDGSFNSETEGWKLSTSTTPYLPYYRHNHDYEIQAYTVDAAGNAETPTATVDFQYVKDLSGTAPIPTPTPTPTAAPTASPTPGLGGLTCFVTSPVNNDNIAVPGPTSINGTASATATVTGVKVSIFNGSSSLYWNGSAWASTVAWIDATGTTAWTLSTLPAWGNGSSYQVIAQATDGTNTQNSPAVLFGIGVAPTPATTPTPTPAPTATPTAAPTATPTAAPTATPAPTPTATPSTSGSGSIGTSGGTVTTGDGKIEVEIPAGAFDSATTVTITADTCHGDTDDFVVGSTCFSVTPDGAIDGTVTICVELSSYDQSLGDNLTLGYWADSTWNEASNVTITGNTICGETDHLSDWAVLNKTSEGWPWWVWVLIGAGAFIIVLAIILLIVLPKKGGKEEVPAEELYGEEEEEF